VDAFRCWVNRFFTIMEKSILEQAKLNWTVRTEKLVTSATNLVTDNIAIVRDDKDVILGVHGSSYVALQNSEMFEILERVSGKMDLPLHKGGYFGNGEKVYIQLKTEDFKLGTDKIEGFLTCVNSFDGSTSLAFGHSNITISCRNTFFANYRELANKVRHTMNMHTRIDLLCTQIEGVLQAEKKIFTQIERMNEVQIDQKVRDMVLTRMLNLQREERLADITTLTTQKRNLLSNMEVSINGQIEDKGETLWGLFSGITHYTTHNLKGDSNENKLFGRYGNREREVFAELGDLVMS